jgi:hypothetical protein
MIFPSQTFDSIYHSITNSLVFTFLLSWSSEAYFAKCISLLQNRGWWRYNPDCTLYKNVLVQLDGEMTDDPQIGHALISEDDSSSEVAIVGVLTRVCWVLWMATASSSFAMCSLMRINQNSKASWFFISDSVFSLTSQPRSRTIHFAL